MMPAERWSFDDAFALEQRGAYVVARPRFGVAGREVERLAVATIPPRFAHYDRAHWRGRWPVPDRLASWPNPSPGELAAPWVVIFLGAVGAGKTMLATAIFREAVTRWGYGGAWLDWSTVLDDVRRSFDAHSTCEAETACMSRRIVLLDDVGAERATPWAAETLSKVLRRRHRENLPTLLTTNARELGELSGAVDGRVLSRIAEGEVIVLGGADRRLHGVGA